MKTREGEGKGSKKKRRNEKRRGRDEEREIRNIFSGFVMFVNPWTHIILWVIKAVASHLRKAAVEVVICGTEKCTKLEGITQEKHATRELEFLSHLG